MKLVMIIGIFIIICALVFLLLDPRHGLLVKKGYKVMPFSIKDAEKNTNRYNRRQLNKRLNGVLLDIQETSENGGQGIELIEYGNQDILNELDNMGFFISTPYVIQGIQEEETADYAIQDTQEEATPYVMVTWCHDNLEVLEAGV